MNITRKKITSRGELSSQITILTYNILADCHVIGSEQICYPFVETEHLLKKEGLKSNRHLLTMKELRHFDADVVLLQEVEDWYSVLLKGEMQSLGYEYHYFEKKGVPEGSSLCFKSARFRCIKTVNFLIHDEVAKICQIERVPEAAVGELERCTVALIGVLEDTANGKYLICAGTHIIYDEFKDPALQALQACLVCQELNQIRQDLSSTMNIDVNEIPIILGGDFNGEPEHATVKLMKNGELLPAEMEELETLSYKVTDKQAVPTKLEATCNVSKYLSKYLFNPLTLCSAYFEVADREPVITSAENIYVGCLDYIFHTPNLKAVACVDIDASLGEVYSNGGPTQMFASDHLPLVADFSY